MPYDSDDFQGCWHETITLVLDSQEFHVPKRLASARLPYVKTYLGSALREVRALNWESKLQPKLWILCWGSSWVAASIRGLVGQE